MRSITNSDDIIDSRDIDARIEELQESAEAEPLDESGTEELAALLALRGDVGYGGEWPYGIGFIRDSYFQTYAEDLADDIGAIDRNATWPCNCIDWEQAARELRMDYSSTELDGVTYWYRS